MGPVGRQPGEFGGYLLKRPEETEFTPMRGSFVPVPVGAQAIVRTGGGGGWGDPLDRDPQLVRSDVIEEYISAEVAERDYGVVLRSDRSLDLGATQQLRASIRQMRSPTASD